LRKCANTARFPDRAFSGPISVREEFPHTAKDRRHGRDHRTPKMAPPASAAVSSKIGRIPCEMRPIHSSYEHATPLTSRAL
jgi:hypothetical protein